jgi:hypothetical protein
MNDKPQKEDIARITNTHTYSLETDIEDLWLLSPNPTLRRMS